MPRSDPFWLKLVPFWLKLVPCGRNFVKCWLHVGSPLEQACSIWAQACSSLASAGTIVAQACSILARALGPAPGHPWPFWLGPATVASAACPSPSPFPPPFRPRSLLCVPALVERSFLAHPLANKYPHVFVRSFCATPPGFDANFHFWCGPRAPENGVRRVFGRFPCGAKTCECIAKRTSEAFRKICAEPTTIFQKNNYGLKPDKKYA